jgi:hypothetical protein
MSATLQTYTYTFSEPGSEADFISATVEAESSFYEVSAFSGLIDGVSFSGSDISGVDVSQAGIAYNLQSLQGNITITPKGGTPLTINLSQGQNAVLGAIEAGLSSIAVSAVPQSYTYNFTGLNGEADFISMTAIVKPGPTFEVSAITGLIDGISFNATNISGLQFSTSGVDDNLGALTGTVTVEPKGAAPITIIVTDAQSIVPGAIAPGTALVATGHETVGNLSNNGVVAVSYGASLDITGAVDPASTGLFVLTAQSSLEISKLLGAGTQIQFVGGSNTLTIDNIADFGLHVGSSAYAGPLLENFQGSDVIDLKNISNVGLRLNYSAVSGDLQISGAGGAVATLRFQNSTLGSGNFHIGTDHAGGSVITHS